ncbi:MAG: murein biosynthesis integral membrane protein MurJ [Actinomycetota bacterium]|nr:murein biosynthesis integral membrane protein MurJ [Actinomycetota bacterium]
MAALPPAEVSEATEAPPSEETPGLGRSAALMTLGTVLSRATGVVRLGLLAATLGITETRLTDAYNLANTAPNILYELVLGGVITAVFVPVFVELLDERDGGERDVSAIVNVALVSLTVLAVVGILAAPLIARFYSSRLSGPDAAAQQEVVTTLLRFFLPQLPLYGLYFMGSAFMNVRRRFVLPMFTQIVNNLVLIGVLIAFNVLYGFVDLRSVTDAQLALLGIGTTISVAPMGVLLLPSLRRLGYRWHWRFDRALWRRMASLSGYAIGFVAANQIGFLAIQWLANRRQGGYTAYVAAFTFFLLPIGLFVWSITTALAPSLSRSALKPGREGMADVLSLAIRSTLFLVVPCTVGFLLLGRPLVEVMLEHDVVTAESTDLIVRILSFLVLGLVQFSIFQVLIRASYALQDARTPFVVNSVAIAFNIAVNVAMFLWIGVVGLAAGHAVTYTLAVWLQGRALTREVPGFDLARVGRSAARIALAAAGMALVLAGVTALSELAVDDPDGVALAGLVALQVTAGGVAYLALCAALRIEELSFVKAALGRKIGYAGPQSDSS